MDILFPTGEMTVFPSTRKELVTWKGQKCSTWRKDEIPSPIDAAKEAREFVGELHIITLDCGFCNNIGV